MAENKKWNDEYGPKINQEITTPGFVSAVDTLNPYGLKIMDKVYDGYEDPYGERVNTLLDSVTKQQPFQYDYNQDPAYQAYRKEYLRNGQRATQDTMAAAATMTGGRPSSYAATAAAQAGSNYAAQLSDKVPELYQQAYNRYLQQYQNQLQQAQLYQNQQQYDFNRYNQGIQNMMAARAQEIGIAESHRDFDYRQRQDRIQNLQQQQAQDWSRFMQQAQMALSVGDYKQLEAMGFDTSRSDFGNQVSMAQIIAQVTGDTSYLRNLMRR